MGLLAGVTSGLGSIGGALLGSGASQAASAQQSQASIMGTLLGLQQQQNMFNQASGALNPYIKAGQGVLPTLQSLITPGASQTATLSKLPGFQFASQWGSMAAQNALTAQGLGGSAGPVGKALSDYNNGLAQTYWGQDVNALQNYAGMGANSASALGGIAANMGNSEAANIMGGLTSAGQAQAAGTLGSANALSSGLQGLGSAGLLSSLAPNSPGSGFSMQNPFQGIYSGAQSLFGGGGGGGGGSQYIGPYNGSYYSPYSAAA